MVRTALGMMNKEPKDFDTKPKMSMSIKTWYDTEYPNDENNKYLKDITFKRFVDLIKLDPQKSVDTAGMHYGVVRERFIYALMSLLNKTHDEIYDFMYNGKSLEESEIKESKMKLETNSSKIKSDVVNQIKRAFDEQDHEVTYFVPLGTDGKNNWAIVVAWMDYDNNDKWQVYGKVAYQPKNSMMQEYDIDWEMPDDTEISITSNSISSSADQLIEYWMWIYNNILNKAEDIGESKMNKNVAKLTEEKFNALVMEYVLEGHSIQESIVLAEDTITPEMINDLEKTPAYKKLKKDIEYYFKAVDGIEGYRDGDFKDAPIEALQDEADFCKDTANFLGSINFRGFKPEKQKELMQDTAADMEYLDRSALRLTNLLKKQDDSMYLRPDGSVNVNTNQKPGEYARRALRKIRDLFARLGQKWDYDPDFDYKSLPPVDYKMFVADSKNISELPDWKQGIMNTVNTAVNEGICDKHILLNMANDLDLNEDQKDFYAKYVYYVLD